MIGAPVTNYVYLAFGKDDRFYLEASYSIGTLLKQIDPRTARVIVFTDNPERVQSWPVICESIADDLEAMKGKTGFSFRVKICAILKCFDLHPGNVIFLDTDTFLRKSVKTIAQGIRPGVGLMDFFYHSDGLPMLAGFQTTLPDGTIYRYEKESWMYNSGVIGLHQADRRVAELALLLCDAFLAAGYRRHTLEQFAVSEAMRLCGIKIVKTKSAIIHYCRPTRRKYVHHQFAKQLRDSKKEPWQFDPISYSLAKVYWHKYRNKIMDKLSA